MPYRGAKKLAAFLSALLLVLPDAASWAAGRLVAATQETYREQLALLQPGDTLQLAAGIYRRGLPVHRLVATPEAPIVIRGPSQGEPAVFIARADANTVSIIDSAYIHIRDLTLDGRGIPVDAVKAEGHARWAHHITLENLTIVNHGADQQNVAISTKCPAWGWVIRGNRIHGAGTGMYLGNSDGSAPFFDGVVEYNLVTDPLGYAIQIKHQRDRPALESAPRGRHVTIIRHNVLSKANGGSAGPRARPNLLLGHWPLHGAGSQDEYLVYGNFLDDNPHEALFQAEGNVAFYSNVLRNLHGPGIHIQPHNDVPRSVRILDNTVITTGYPIVVRMNETPSEYAQIVAGNAVFSPRPVTGGKQARNAAFPLRQAGELLQSPADRMPLDPHPKDEALRCEPLEASLIEGLIDADCDFDGRRRERNYCGAYAAEGTDPAWLPALEIKPSTVCGRS